MKYDTNFVQSLWGGAEDLECIHRLVDAHEFSRSFIDGRQSMINCLDEIESILLPDGWEFVETLQPEAVAIAVQTGIFHFVWIPASKLVKYWQDHWNIIGSAELDTEHNRVWIESYQEISEFVRV